MYFFHNARYRALHDSGVYLYLPKLEHYLEARLWNDVFVRAQDLLGIPQGTVKATVLIEHILAAFQMEEILYELRHHSAGLNCGMRSSSSAWNCCTSARVTLRPSTSLPRGLWTHCQTCVREISAVAASSLLESEEGEDGQATASPAGEDLVPLEKAA